MIVGHEMDRGTVAYRVAMTSNGEELIQIRLRDK